MVRFIRIYFLLYYLISHFYLLFPVVVCSVFFVFIDEFLWLNFTTHHFFFFVLLHSLSFVHPQTRMSPIYAVTSWFSLVFPAAEGYLAIIKDGYEAYIIYQVRPRSTILCCVVLWCFLWFLVVSSYYSDQRYTALLVLYVCSPIWKMPVMQCKNE